MVSTITFSVGEATIADSVDSARAPPAYMPLANRGSAVHADAERRAHRHAEQGVGERITEADPAQIAEQGEERGAE